MSLGQDVRASARDTPTTEVFGPLGHGLKVCLQCRDHTSGQDLGHVLDRAWLPSKYESLETFALDISCLACSKTLGCLANLAVNTCKVAVRACHLLLMVTCATRAFFGTAGLISVSDICKLASTLIFDCVLLNGYAATSSTKTILVLQAPVANTLECCRSDSKGLDRRQCPKGFVVMRQPTGQAEGCSGEGLSTASKGTSTAYH